MVVILLCAACLLFTSCQYDLQNAFYRSHDTDARAKTCHTLKDSEIPHPAGDVYTVAIFSDIHFGGKKTRHEQDFLNWLTKAKNNGTAPAFCICVGDLAEHGYEREFAAYNEFSQQIEAILGGGRVYNVLGNHDLYNNGWNNYHEMIFPYESFYTFKTKTFSWYCIDSASGTLGRKQFEMIEDLFENDPAPKIVLTHIPAYSNPMNFMGYYSFQNTYETDILLTLYSKSNVKMVVSGHIHQSYKNFFHSFQELTVSSITESNRWTVLTIDEKNGTVSEQQVLGGE